MAKSEISCPHFLSMLVFVWLELHVTDEYYHIIFEYICAHAMLSPEDTVPLPSSISTLF